ncbi:MAG: MATE family efflux transporter [Clostridia bacterium]|nr:MATE family efflux transporter [Clostridia bacterium]
MENPLNQPNGEIRENKMGILPIPKLLFTMSVPIIISMLVQALYNIVDSVFVAMYDNVAGTAALTLAFPMQNLMIAVAVGLAVGMNALLSRALGEKNFERANKIAGQGFFLTLCGYVLFLIIGIFAVEFYVGTQAGNGETRAKIMEFGVDYLSIICICSIGVFIQVTCERLLQATGKTMLSMVVQLAGAVTNIILDPIMIFSFGWGIKGAAIATVIGQLVSAALGLLFNLKYNREITIRLFNIIPTLSLIREILIIGIPSVLMQAIGSVMTFCMNKVLGGFGVDAMNIFGIYFKLQSFIFMPVFGLNNGMVPIIAYNYGARKRERVMKTIRLAAVCAVAYMLLGLAIFQLFPAQLLGIFNASESMLAIGQPALRTISLSFIFAGFCIVTSSVCQALGKSIYSLFSSIGRQLVVLIPSAYLLSLSGKLDLVWWAIPIAEIVSVALSVVFMTVVLKKVMPKSEFLASDLLDN